MKAVGRVVDEAFTKEGGVGVVQLWVELEENVALFAPDLFDERSDVGQHRVTGAGLKAECSDDELH